MWTLSSHIASEEYKRKNKIKKNGSKEKKAQWQYVYIIYICEIFCEQGFFYLFYSNLIEKLCPEKQRDIEIHLKKSNL